MIQFRQLIENRVIALVELDVWGRTAQFLVAVCCYVEFISFFYRDYLCMNQTGKQYSSKPEEYNQNMCYN